MLAYFIYYLWRVFVNFFLKHSKTFPIYLSQVTNEQNFDHIFKHLKFWVFYEYRIATHSGPRNFFATPGIFFDFHNYDNYPIFGSTMKFPKSYLSNAFSWNSNFSFCNENAFILFDTLKKVLLATLTFSLILSFISVKTHDAKAYYHTHLMYLVVSSVLLRSGT